MPYISAESRYNLEENAEAPTSAGELNYCITKMCDAYAVNQHNYSKFNEIIGVLECAKLEFYRRLVAPYEDIKREDNGDVYSA